MTIQAAIRKAMKRKGVVKFFRASSKHLTFIIDTYDIYPRNTGNGLDIINCSGELAVLEIEDILADDWGVESGR